MTLKEDREDLAALEERRSRVIAAMAKISARFVVQVSRELPERWERIVRLYITDRPNEAMALGSNGLHRLKSELIDLAGQAPGIAAKHLSGRTVWTHIDVDIGGNRDGYHPDVMSSSTGPRRWSRISGPVSHVEAEVLSLLEPGFGSEGGPWLRSAGGKLSPPLEAVIEAYQKLHFQLVEIDQEREGLYRQIVMKEAQQLWDNA